MKKFLKFIFHNPFTYFYMYLWIGFFIFSCKQKVEPQRVEILSIEKIYSLNTKWKYKTGNVSEAASMDYNDSDWNLIQVPGLWRDMNLLGNRHIWYRLDIYISSEFQNKQMGVFVPGIFEGYELFINGNKIGSDGEIDRQGNLIKSTNKINFYSILPNYIKINQRNTIALHILDQHNWGGINGDFYLGEYSLVKSKFIFYLIRSITLNGFFLIFGICLFFVTIINRKLLIFLLFSLISIFSSICILFLERVLGWIITDFQLLHYSFSISQALLSILYLLATRFFFQIKSNFVSRFLEYTFIPIFIICIVSGINKEMLSIRNTVFEPILIVYSFIASLYVMFLVIISFLNKKIEGIFFIFVSSSIIFIILMNMFINYYMKNSGTTLLYMSESFAVFFVSLLYSVVVQYLKTEKKAKEMEENYQKDLEEEVLLKTTKISEYNKELKASNTMRDKLFSIIGHDLRSPLNTLKMILYLFNDDKITMEQLKTNIRQLSHTLEQNYLLLENLLQWASIQLERSPIRIIEFDLVTLVQEVISLFIPLADKKDIFLFSNSQGQVIVQSNRNAILIVLNNLVNNSIKFTHNSGFIEILLIEKGSTVTISVIDTGIGIPVEPSVFMNCTDDYIRKGTNTEKGTGLGLRVCKELLGQINSKLVYEKNPNGGSIFSFSITK